MKQHTITIPKCILTYTNPEEAELVYAELDRLYRILSRARVRVREYINANRKPL